MIWTLQEELIDVYDDQRIQEDFPDAQEVQEDVPDCEKNPEAQEDYEDTPGPCPSLFEYLLGIAS